MQNHKCLIQILFWGGLLALLASCSGRKEGSEKAQRLSLAVSIEPMRYFVEHIAGEDYKVVTMVPKGSNPETYEPTPRQLLGLAESKAYFRIGPIGFEQVWMKRLENSAPDMEVFDASEGVPFIRESEVVHKGHSHPGGVDPHVWTSPVNARIIARNICMLLSDLFPKDSVGFRLRYQALDSLIVRTDSRIKETLSSKKADSLFLIYHPTLSYFARDYGLCQICVEENGKEPSSARLKELIDSCRNHRVRVIFVQREFDVRNAELIAAETGTKIVPINPLGYDWEAEMLYIVNTLVYEK